MSDMRSEPEKSVIFPTVLKLVNFLLYGRCWYHWNIIVGINSTLLSPFVSDTKLKFGVLKTGVSYSFIDEVFFKNY